MRPVRGFTLIELMVTIAVLAVIAIIAAPSFSNMILRQNLNSSGKTLVSAFTTARTKAALERRNIRVMLNTQPQANTDTSLSWSPNGKTVQNTSGGNLTAIIFRPDGFIQKNNETTPASTNIQIRLCEQATSANLSKIVTVSFLGGVARESAITNGCS
ncbi:GspH/FimT family pseudopilin [Acinetobacter nectaris]|uniref:GspH/FimT family pseudopilin n=1 Tax=Acinetobacter nectaris TaxID=1219382 RepID=UPI001F43C5C9|nr:GspH/FimT family pseudopilin [Acinetobacter nectaris]MCF9045448.1 prepilin-type N-terminal cleavage/methylation domain-containing protein [Acinetobacter nectaris]